MDYLNLRKAFFVLLAGTLIQGTALAGYDYKFESKPAPMGQFESEMGSKLTRGVTNLIFGWTELVQAPVFMSQEPKANPLKVIFLGIPYGVIRAVGRTGIGVYEMVTFYAPQPPIMRPIEGEVV